MTIAAHGPGGMPSHQTSSFTTVTPDYQTEVYLDTVGGTPIQDGGTYGVGTVVVARFDEPVEIKTDAERHLVVTTTPPVHGSWYWLDDQTTHWRPEKCYAPGTSVTVSANIYGAPLGDGLYGQRDEHVSFKIGDSHVSIADDNTKQVSVYENGKLVRSMPTSMGMGGTETIGGTTRSFWTSPGVYTVMDNANPVTMDSSTFGLPINSRLGYRVTIFLRHPDQHRRHLPPPAHRHRMGAGQHQHLTRLPESQRRERKMVLRQHGRGCGPFSETSRPTIWACSTICWASGTATARCPMSPPTLARAD